MGGALALGGLFSGKGRQIAKATPLGFAANEIYKNVKEVREPVQQIKSNIKQMRQNFGTQQGSLLTPVSNQSKSLLGS